MRNSSSNRRLNRSRVATALGAILVVAVLVTGCGDSDSATGVKPGDKVDVPDDKFTAMTDQASVAISVIDNTFEPQYTTIAAGTKVTWTNNGRNQHNIVPSNKGAFATAKASDFTPGSSYSLTFDQAGDYPYYCSIHGTAKGSGQYGVLRVVAKP